MMKRILIVLMMVQLMTLPSESADQPAYVTREEYSQQLQTLTRDIHELTVKVDKLTEKVDKLGEGLSALSERLTGISERLSGRIDAQTERITAQSQRIDDLRNNIYLGLVVLGIVIALPSIRKFQQWQTDRKPQVTLEDVKRLLAEYEATNYPQRSRTPS